VVVVVVVAVVVALLTVVKGAVGEVHDEAIAVVAVTGQPRDDAGSWASLALA